MYQKKVATNKSSREKLLPVIGVMAIISARCQGTENRREMHGEQDNGREKR